MFFLMHPGCKNPKLFLLTQFTFAGSSLIFSAFKYPKFLMPSGKLIAKTQ
jgi:hypothetical protein